MSRVVDLKLLAYLDGDDKIRVRATEGAGSAVTVTEIRERHWPNARSPNAGAYGVEIEIDELVADVIDTLRAERGEDVRGDMATPEESPTPSPSPDACNLPLRYPHIGPEETCERCEQQAQAHRYWHGEGVRRED